MRKIPALFCVADWMSLLGVNDRAPGQSGPVKDSFHPDALKFLNSYRSGNIVTQHQINPGIDQVVRPDVFFPACRARIFSAIVIPRFSLPSFIFIRPAAKIPPGINPAHHAAELPANLFYQVLFFHPVCGIKVRAVSLVFLDPFQGEFAVLNFT